MLVTNTEHKWFYWMRGIKAPPLPPSKYLQLKAYFALSSLIIVIPLLLFGGANWLQCKRNKIIREPLMLGRSRSHTLPGQLSGESLKSLDFRVHFMNYRGTIAVYNSIWWYFIYLFFWARYPEIVANSNFYFIIIIF